MSDLDEKLKEILQANSGYGSMSDEYVITQIKQAFAEDGYDKHDWSISKGSVMIDGMPHMTGEEWYQKFLLELPNQPNKYAKSTILMAAKRAGGISDE